MLRINKVKDRKAENKRSKLAKAGASKSDIAKVKDDLSKKSKSTLVGIELMVSPLLTT